MTVFTLLAWALFCFFMAFVAFNGIRKSSFWLGFVAFCAMMILGSAGFDALIALNAAARAYARGDTPNFALTGSIWSILALVFVWTFTPRWLGLDLAWLVRKHESAR